LSSSWKKVVVKLPMKFTTHTADCWTQKKATTTKKVSKSSLKYLILNYNKNLYFSVQFQHFLVPPELGLKKNKILMKCDENFLSGGTTGLSLWQASG